MSNFKNTAKPITDADLNSVQAGAGYLKFDGVEGESIDRPASADIPAVDFSLNYERIRTT